ncbi:MAG: hypothetical protein MJY83_02355, partial [Bacteroidales bacterium]|nr:hypothetical protein [Bacteroidales bacterium]
MNLRHFLLTITGMVTFSACHVKPAENNDLDKYGLNQTVKSIYVDADDDYIRSSHYEAFFNRYGQVEQVRYLESDGTLIIDEKYFYDSSHHLTKVWPIGADGQETGRFEYEFDGEFISKYTVINMNNQEIKRWEYSYDGERVVRIECFEENELRFVTTNTYDGDTYFQVLMDEQGDTLNMGYLRDLAPNKPLSAHSEDFNFDIEYDDMQLPVKSIGTMVDSNGALYWDDILDEAGYATYEYEYDSKGNWTTRRVFFGDERLPGEVITR